MRVENQKKTEKIQVCAQKPRLNTPFKNSISGVAPCVSLLPRPVRGQGGQRVVRPVHAAQAQGQPPVPLAHPPLPSLHPGFQAADSILTPHSLLYSVVGKRGGAVSVYSLVGFGVLIRFLPGQMLHCVFPIYRGLFEDKVGDVWCALDMLLRLRANLRLHQLTRLCLLSTLTFRGSWQHPYSTLTV
jgi:hypothetical protein